MAAAKPAVTVSEYLAGLEPDRKQALTAVRKLVKQQLPPGYVETMQYGMITYVVPLKRYPAGYLGKKDVPLPYLSLASQKSHMAVYLMGVYGDPARLKSFTAACKKAGKKLDMGKSCLRFQRLDDLALPALGDSIASLSVEQYIDQYERSRP